MTPAGIRGRRSGRASWFVDEDGDLHHAAGRTTPSARMPRTEENGDHVVRDRAGVAGGTHDLSRNRSRATCIRSGSLRCANGTVGLNYHRWDVCDSATIGTQTRHAGLPHAARADRPSLRRTVLRSARRSGTLPERNRTGQMTRLGSPERRLRRKHQAFFVSRIIRPTDRTEPYRKPTLTKNRAYACFPRPDGREHRSGRRFFRFPFPLPFFSPGDGLSKFSKAINILKIRPFRSHFESNPPQAGHATRRHPLRPTVARVWQEPIRLDRPPDIRIPGVSSRNALHDSVPG